MALINQQFQASELTAAEEAEKERQEAEQVTVFYFW